MTDMPWLRLYTDTVDNEKIRLLAFEDRWHYIAILCCMQQGILKKNDKLLERKLSVKLGLQVREVEEVKRRLMEVNLIDNNFVPIGWEKHQFKSDSSTDRVRKHRENKEKKECNVTETFLKQKCNAIDTDTDTDTDTDNNKDIVQGCTPKTKVLVPYDEIISVYHEILPTLAQVYKLSDTRKRYIKKLWLEELEDIESWRNYFIHVSRSDFLMGKVNDKAGRPFIATIDFIINPTNFIKIAEEKYHEKKVQQRRQYI
jgi:hypothetical protein